MTEKRSYLGDGLYVEITGGMLRLYTMNGMEIFMVPEVVASFREYIRFLEQGQEQRQEQEQRQRQGE